MAGFFHPMDWVSSQFLFRSRILHFAIVEPPSNPWHFIKRIRIGSVAE